METYRSGHNGADSKYSCLLLNAPSKTAWYKGFWVSVLQIDILSNDLSNDFIMTNIVI